MGGERSADFGHFGASRAGRVPNDTCLISEPPYWGWYGFLATVSVGLDWDGSLRTVRSMVSDSHKINLRLKLIRVGTMRTLHYEDEDISRS